MSSSCEGAFGRACRLVGLVVGKSTGADAEWFARAARASHSAFVCALLATSAEVEVRGLCRVIITAPALYPQECHDDGALRRQLPLSSVLSASVTVLGLPAWRDHGLACSVQ